MCKSSRCKVPLKSTRTVSAPHINQLKGIFWAKIDDHVALPEKYLKYQLQENADDQSLKPIQNDHLKARNKSIVLWRKDGTGETKDISDLFGKPQPKLGFNPPDFGVTVLGCVSLEAISPCSSRMDSIPRGPLPGTSSGSTARASWWTLRRLPATTSTKSASLQR